VVSKHNYRHRK
ncbi:unnamed protein product, partial [Leptidea sinapis]